MFAELYLAEEAFALHLLLQHPEGLVDIGVAAIPSIRETGIRLWTVPVPTATVVRIPCGRHNRAGSNQIITIS
jgi:hypothetical protein